MTSKWVTWNWSSASAVLAFIKGILVGTMKIAKRWVSQWTTLSVFVLLRAGETDESLLLPVTNEPIPSSGVYSTAEHELLRLVLYLDDVH